MSTRVAFYRGLVLGEGLNKPEKVSIPLQSVESVPAMSSSVTTLRTRGGASEYRVKFETRLWKNPAESRRDFQIRRISFMKSIRKVAAYVPGSYALFGTLLFIEDAATDIQTAAVSISAGLAVTITLSGEHNFTVGDWVAIYDPATQVHDVAEVTLVAGATIKASQVDNNYSAGVAVARVLWGIRNALPVSLPEIQGDEPGQIVASPNLPFEFVSVEEPFGKGIP